MALHVPEINSSDSALSMRHFGGAKKCTPAPSSRQCGEEQTDNSLTIVFVLSDAERVRTV